MNPHPCLISRKNLKLGKSRPSHGQSHIPMNLIRQSNDDSEEIDFENEVFNDEHENWFDPNNNDNVDGNKAILDDWNNDDQDIEEDKEMLGVVKPEVSDMDRFLGRIPDRKPKMRILANDFEGW